MDWREGIDPDRRLNQEYVLHREYVEECKRREKWEANQERLVDLLVTDIKPLQKFRIQSLTLFSALSVVVTGGFALMNWFLSFLAK